MAGSLFGGPWYDASGKPLANGYLIVRLNQDASDGVNQYCASNPIKVILDANGATAVSVPDAATLTPSGTTYAVTAYTAAGQPVWGPQYLTN